METLAEITAFIDTNIRNFLPLVRKVNHANVHQKVTNQMFPDSVKIEWNGTSEVDPIADIVCNPNLTTTGKISFEIYFTKHGNRVFYNGFLVSLETSRITPNLVLVTFPTTLYRPLENFSSYSRLTNVNQSILLNTVILFQSTGVISGSGIPVNTGLDIYHFEGSYKVAN